MSDLDKKLDGLAIDDEEMTARHRKERKELQAKIQALKKTAGKKNKKEVLDEIARLEWDLNQKHDNESAELTKEATIEVSTATKKGESVVHAEDAPTVRVSRAQKRREKKAIEEKTHQAEILAQEELNKTGQRALEIDAIKKLLSHRDLELYPIPSDGKRKLRRNFDTFLFYINRCFSPTFSRKLPIQCDSSSTKNDGKNSR